MKLTFKKIAAATSLLVSALGAHAGVIVNLDATSNLRQEINLAAGTYRVTFLDSGPFGAAYDWNLPNGNGFRTVTDLYIDDSVSAFKVGLYDNSATPWATESAAVSAANAKSYVFTTNGSGVDFVVSDNSWQYGDNSGGVSLLVETVPEPSTCALIFAGLVAAGLSRRRRQA